LQNERPIIRFGPRSALAVAVAICAVTSRSCAEKSSSASAIATPSISAASAPPRLLTRSATRATSGSNPFASSSFVASLNRSSI